MCASVCMGQDGVEGCQGLGHPVWTYAWCNHAGRAGYCVSLSSMDLDARMSPCHNPNDHQKIIIIKE